MPLGAKELRSTEMRVHAAEEDSGYGSRVRIGVSREGVTSKVFGSDLLTQARPEETNSLEIGRQPSI